ncbi:hypothetical protein DOTSEDRAFT_174325 [Dothistroma septosporum NZE10]|uniref:SH3 domain-containing protein n=1 Tax=Dothistroma septosporum (strain NZE10 / CBS 128990) TaxID=675120 RepID=M2YNC4_DOTSN|nr:hypothetical protein DOTSEDRAFT_174325 [Dothistroma septosporum NZE10]
MAVSEELPRFPCWCKATYSWGGETKKDLGFIEGDLIEALNAGDGSWWMGRLRRDPRAVGLFPSNFVQVLDESFQPAPNSRNVTPLRQPKQSGSARNKSLFRKPYQAYEEFDGRHSLDGAKSGDGTPESDREKMKREKSKFRPYSSMKTAQAPTGTVKKQGGKVIIPEDTAPRIPAPPPRGGEARRSRSPRPPPAPPAPSTSPTPQPQYQPHRAPSPQPVYRSRSPAPPRSHSPLPASYHDGSAYPQMLPAISQQTSPISYEQPLYYSRAPSRADIEEDDVNSSPPPPPPPAHRVAYQPSRAPSLELEENMNPQYYRDGTPTPVPPSPGGSHMTPSPLRAAMNDVMSSLQDMSGFQPSSPARADTPPKMWSPDAFEDTTAKTGAANARSTIGNASTSRPGSRAGSRAGSPTKMLGMGPNSISGDSNARPRTAPGAAARDMGLGGGNDWMQVRRDINRSNSLSQRERAERSERCELHDLSALQPINELLEIVEGDESLDGLPITEPTDFNLPNLALVDKSTRFVQNVPPMISASSLAQSYLCRPHRSDVSRLRAIFIWVAERIAWEDDFEGQLDTRRVIQTKRGCSEEIALLVRDMCSAVGLHAEVVRGYLKGPGEVLDADTLARPNHWWNTVIVDGEWRIIDCALASPTHPRRGAYSYASSQVAEPWYFLTRPMEICYTHIPLLPEHQHMVPPVDHEILAALPCACPAYFRNAVELADFDTSMLHLENLEMAHIHVNVPEDVECVAETEARSFAQDADGDYFESGDVVTKKAFAQAEWVGGRKRFTVKALLPGDDGLGVLKIYAGKRGLMHSIKDNPHSMALALPLSHHGQNPPYDFVTRHPTPHAQRHDLYIAQPQCARLTMNNTFVFCIRQHPSSLSRFTPDTWGASTSNTGRPQSPNPVVRPTSAMSMISVSASTSGSQYSESSSNSGNDMTPAQQKPAKLAIQSPSQKIIRLTRKQEHTSRNVEEDMGLTTTWETVIKIGERGLWRGLVLADRSARWCVFAEWECV